jgi:hypothetical protein
LKLRKEHEGEDGMFDDRFLEGMSPETNPDQDEEVCQDLIE